MPFMDFSNQLILKDFDVFLTFLNEHAPLELTNDKALLKGKYLIPLNLRMKSFQTLFITEKSKQDVFILLQTFFFIAEKAQITLKKSDPKTGKNSLHLNIERAKLYDELTDNEQYFCLLDSFWSHISWEKAYECRFFHAADFYLQIVADYPVGKKILIQDRNLKREGDIRYRGENFVVETLQAFGCLALEWDITLEKRRNKYIFPYQSITVTPLGKELIPILFSEYGQQFLYPNDWIEDIFQDEDVEMKTLSDVFKLSISGWNIENKLLPIEYEMVEGKYHLKISLNKKCYRVIEIGGNFTFNDLHTVIQEAFNFEDDHLYAFYMDNEAHSQDDNSTYWGPRCQDGKYYAEEVLIGEVGLIKGKKFLYLFDFGANWHFEVLVEAIFPDEEEENGGSIIKSVGKSPEQYEE